MKVILAVDQPEFNEAIVDFVKKQVWPAGTAFRLIHVVRPIYDYAYAAAVPDLMIDMHRESQKAAEINIRHTALLLRDFFHANNIGEIIEEGNPAEVLLEAAKNWPADLIIIGSHGRNAVGRLLLGSVSSCVVSHADCSVVVVKLPEGKKKTETSQNLKEKEMAK